jgi:hypothetical protein
MQCSVHLKVVNTLSALPPDQPVSANSASLRPLAGVSTMKHRLSEGDSRPLQLAVIGMEQHSNRDL